MRKKRTELLQVRFTTEEKNLLSVISEKSRIPMSELVRMAAFSYIPGTSGGVDMGLAELIRYRMALHEGTVND